MALSTRDLASRRSFFIFWTWILYIFQFFFPQLAMIIILLFWHCMRCPFLSGQSKLLSHSLIDKHNPFPLISTVNFLIRASSRHFSAFNIIGWNWILVLPWLFRATLVVWISHVVLSLRVLFTILAVITFTIILFLWVKILLWWRNKCLLWLQHLLFLWINFNWSFRDTPA